MVVVSFFTKEIPRDELGGLTWPTINDPPISHGAIGENVEKENDEKTENGEMQIKCKNGSNTNEYSLYQKSITITYGLP